MSDSKLSSNLNDSFLSSNSSLAYGPAQGKYVALDVTCRSVPQFRNGLAQAPEEAAAAGANATTLKITNDEDQLYSKVKRAMNGMNMEFMEQRPELISVVPTISQKTVNIDNSVLNFLVTDSAEPHLATIVQKTLKVASNNYYYVVEFIQDNITMSVGRVNQALSAAMEIILGDYLVFVEGIASEIKRNNVKLTGLINYIQSKADVVAALAEVARKVQEAKSRGGHTLSIIHDLVMNEVPKSTKYSVFHFLITQASIPFLESVQKWVFQGIIYDPYNEFMIEGQTLINIHKDVATEEYWTKRYSVRKQYVPNFLQNLEDQIFNAGRYLNAVQQCSSHPIDSPMQELVYSVKSTEYNETILSGYKFASEKFVDVMINDYKIIDRIKSIKRYLLLQQGDLVVQIFNTCEEELKKPASDVNPTQLTTLIETAIKSPSTNDDIYRDDITVTIKPQDLTSQVFKILGLTAEEANHSKNPVPLIGLEAVSLGLKKKWPVSLVFNQKIVSCYQMIFRQLMYCKFIDQLLTKVWLWNKKLKSLPPDKMEGYMRVVSLRHKMLVTVQHLEYYMVESIEHNWNDFLGQVSRIENIDDLLNLHWNFIESCMNDCLLTCPSIFKSSRKLLSVCQEFCEYIENIHRPKTHGTFDEFQSTIIRLDGELQISVKQFITLISSATKCESGDKLTDLVYRFEGLQLAESQQEKS